MFALDLQIFNKCTCKLSITQQILNTKKNEDWILMITIELIIGLGLMKVVALLKFLRKLNFFEKKCCLFKRLELIY